jgi:hypothetical protein
MPRLTFLSRFVICLNCLAVGSAVFFAALNGVPQTIWADELSRMTSVIAVLFVGASIYLGWQAWLADEGRQTSASISAISPSAERDGGLGRDRDRPFAAGEGACRRRRRWAAGQAHRA